MHAVKMGRTTSVSTAEALSHDGPAIHFGRHLCGLHTFAPDINEMEKVGLLPFRNRHSTAATSCSLQCSSFVSALELLCLIEGVGTLASFCDFKLRERPLYTQRSHEDQIQVCLI